MDDEQKKVADEVAAHAIAGYRHATETEGDAPLNAIEGALHATVTQAMADAFAGIANPVNPGQSQSLARDGAVAGSGLMRDADLGHLTGIEPAPLVATQASEYPKWVVPHASWVVQDPSGRPMAPLLGEPHIDRANNLTVVVQDKEEEDRVLGQAPSEEKAETDRVAAEEDAFASEEAREEAAIAAEEKRLDDARKAHDAQRAAEAKARLKTQK